VSRNLSIDVIWYHLDDSQSRALDLVRLECRESTKQLVGTLRTESVRQF
jgi:hypothetical protein